MVLTFILSANERTPDVDFGKVVPLPASSATANSADATGVSSKGSLEDIKSGGNFTRANETLKPKPTKAVDFRPAKADAEDVDATSSSEPSATPSFSGKKNRTKTRVSSESGASGKPYLETFLFWMYVVGTISFATIIGLQVI